MKVGSESRAKLVVAVVLMVVALAAVGNWIFGSSGTPAAAAPARPSDNALALQDPVDAAQPVKKTVQPKKNSHSPSLDPTLHLDWLKLSEDTEYKGSGRNIFQAQIEPPQPIAPAVTDHPAAAKNVPAAPAGPPPPPPIDLKFFGFASRPGEEKRVFLRQDGDVFIAREGEIVDNRYKVLRITPNAVEIEDVLNNNRQEIPLTQG